MIDIGPEDSVRIHAMLLDAELWVAPTDLIAEELLEKLKAESKVVPVLTAREGMMLGELQDMAAARAYFAPFAQVQRVMGGGRLRGVSGKSFATMRGPETLKEAKPWE